MSPKSERWPDSPSLRDSRPSGLVSCSVAQDGERLVRKVRIGSHVGSTEMAVPDLPYSIRRLHPDKAWAVASLRGFRPLPSEPAERTTTLRVADFFCGAGGFSAGFDAAAIAIGIGLDTRVAVDLNGAALQVYRRNHPGTTIVKGNVDSMLDYAVRFDRRAARFAYRPEVLEASLQDEVGQVDLVIGGPPCQGHSGFNNHTRGTDRRNSLYLTLPAVGIALGARAIAIENVPGVRSDRSGVVKTAIEVLKSDGYHVDEGILDGARLGVPQLRKRHFLVATRAELPIGLKAMADGLRIPSLHMWDAISDLEDAAPDALFDVAAHLSAQNRDRVAWLFENDEYDLPNAERPDCHKEGHSYPSVYGRMHQDRPASTITGGFRSPGRGRFIHPTRRRGLTAHEAARLQGFPDSYRFEREDGATMSGADFARLIGNAIPPPMGFAVALPLLATLLTSD